MSPRGFAVLYYCFSFSYKFIFISFLDPSIIQITLHEIVYLLEICLLSILSFIALYPDQAGYSSFVFYFVKICFVPQDMIYFRKASMYGWVECVFFGVWVEYSVGLTNPFDI